MTKPKKNFFRMTLEAVSKKKMCSGLLIYLFCFQAIGLISQTMQGTMKYIFIDGEEMGIYTGGIHIHQGILKVGEVLKPKDENGSEFTFIVKEIKDDDLNEILTSLASGKNGFIVMETTDKKKLAKNPTGSLYFGKQNTEARSENPVLGIGSSCLIDGKVWNGANYYKSSSYFPNGNSLLKTKNPYLIISFKAANAPDDRQLTIQFENIKPKIGKLDKNSFEFVISGDEQGVKENACFQSNWKNGQANTTHTDFYFECTKWEDKGDHLILSAKYSGTLYGLNLFKGLSGTSCKDLQIKDGEIKNLKIEKH